MTDLDIRPSCDCGDRITYIADRPIDFATWIAIGEELDTELVRGVMIPRMSAQYPYEWIFVWLLSIMRHFATHRKLGTVLGSRSAVKIRNNDGRLPDILFVRADNVDIIHKDAIYGVPDLVVEIVSENDRPSNLIPLEADYCDLGIPEILFINPRKKQVRHLQKNDNGSVNDYEETLLTTGRLAFSSIPDFHIEVEWLFADDKPDEFDTTKQLIEAAEANSR